MDTTGIFTKETQNRLWNALTEDEKQKFSEALFKFFTSNKEYRTMYSDMKAAIYMSIFGADNVVFDNLPSKSCEVKPEERKPKVVICDVGPRYFEDAEVDGYEDANSNPRMPLTYIDRDGVRRWKIAIDLESGKVHDWPEGITANVYYKVCDDGIYTFVDEKFSELAVYDGYVPDFLAIYDEGYGDYIYIEIDEKGYIKDWKFTEKYYKDLTGK